MDVTPMFQKAARRVGELGMSQNDSNGTTSFGGVSEV